MMTNDDYRDSVEQLLGLGILTRAIDLPGVMERIALAEATGPILDPTLWIKSHHELDRIKRLVKAAMPLWLEIKRQVEERAAASLRKG